LYLSNLNIYLMAKSKGSNKAGLPSKTGNPSGPRRYNMPEKPKGGAGLPKSKGNKKTN
jgi:hypothetical protein